MATDRPGSGPGAQDPGQQQELLEYVERLRHDLGKYIAFQLRWLPAQPSTEELRLALVADLAQTHRSAAQVESGPQIWRRSRPALVGEAPLPGGALADLSADPDLRAIDEAMAVIGELIPQLEHAGLRQLQAGAIAARAVASALSRLRGRLREGQR